MTVDYEICEFDVYECIMDFVTDFPCVKSYFCGLLRLKVLPWAQIHLRDNHSIDMEE